MVRSTEPVDLRLDVQSPADVTSGGGAWPFQVDQIHDTAWFDDVFTDLELEAIIALGEQMGVERASVFGGDIRGVRDSHVRFMYPNEHTQWIYQRLTGSVVEANRQYFGFDLSGFEQGLQFTRYVAPHEHYEWHVDRGYGIGIRKLSLSLQLSDPDSYEGGDLEVGTDREPQRVLRKRGRITFFPSWAQHRVTPVTSGVRYSLVGWIGGPAFR